jgi:hypothetical protein
VFYDETFNYECRNKTGVCGPCFRFYAGKSVGEMR